MLYEMYFLFRGWGGWLWHRIYYHHAGKKSKRKERYAHLWSPSWNAALLIIGSKMFSICGSELIIFCISLILLSGDFLNWAVCLNVIYSCNILSGSLVFDKQSIINLNIFVWHWLEQKWASVRLSRLDTFDWHKH